ncbi:MAG: DUF4421 domain-containing protein [Cytophagales bacterium]|nr:MAG: DUF4421 domain-containing protein [Cytophagales bacterium]
MKYLLSILLISTTYTLAAQNDSSYIQKFEDYMLIKTGATYRGLDLTLSPRINGITQFLEPLWYRPSVRNSVSVGVNFKGLAISFGFKLAQHPLIRDRQGESKYFDLQVHSFGKKLGYDIYYQEYQGYFIEDISNLINNIITGQALQRRDDIRLQNFSVNVFYTFNGDKFSYRAAFVHDEKQNKNGGSFIINGSLGYFNAKADSSFTTNNIGINFRPEAAFNQNTFYTFAITPGYAHTFIVKKHFYISASASGLVGLQYHEGQAQNNNTQVGLNYFLKGIARASVGYHTQKWVIGASAMLDLQAMNTEFVQYRTNNLEISAFLAHRFKVKWMAGKKSFFGGKKKN